MEIRVFKSLFSLCFCFVFFLSLYLFVFSLSLLVEVESNRHMMLVASEIDFLLNRVHFIPDVVFCNDGIE